MDWEQALEQIETHNNKTISVTVLSLIKDLSAPTEMCQAAKFLFIFNSFKIHLNSKLKINSVMLAWGI